MSHPGICEAACQIASKSRFGLLPVNSLNAASSHHLRCLPEPILRLPQVGLKARREVARITDEFRELGRRVMTPRGMWWSCILGLALVHILQAPGRTTFDTKLDLVVEPSGFMARSLDLWSPDSGLGELQNQAYGYLFPIGPFFAVGDWLAMPPWVWERLWSFLLTVLAFEGVRRLARAWGGLGPRGCLLAGIAFVVAPRFLGTVGVLTGETLPSAVTAWAVLPLVLARRGRLDGYVAAGLSALAVLCMGGHNAVETLATLPLPAAVLAAAVLCRQLSWRHALAWLAAVTAVCWWWLGPLLLLGRYSPPFLDYIESAQNTTGPVGWFNAFRGADHWLAFISLGDFHWWEAGFALATSSFLVIATTLIALLGTLGLMRADVPDRTTLLLPLALGLVCLVAAHGTWAGGLFAPDLRQALDGALAPLRNIHKVDPLVRLPLALGFGYFARSAVPALRAMRARRSRQAWSYASVSLVVGALACTLLGVAAQPALAGQLRFEPGWRELPTAWDEAARAIDDLPPGSRVLIAPGSGFALQTWGYTVDEPLQPLTSTPWIVRGQAPLAPGQSIRMMDQVESLIASGREQAGLVDVLTRVGITHVLVRNDLDPDPTDAPSADVVEKTLGLSGLSSVDTFESSARDDPRLTLWKAPGSKDARLRVFEGAETIIAGGGENPPDLVSRGLLAPGRPAVLTSDLDDGTAPDLLTDGVQRRERTFGRVHDALSSLMTLTDGYRLPRPVHDLGGDELDRSVAWYPAITHLGATSSAGYADVFGAVRPEFGPYSAIDGDPTTSWVNAPFSEPTDQGLQMTFAAPEELPRVEVAIRGLAGEPAITAVKVSTDSESLTQRVEPATGIAEFIFETKPTRHLDVSVAAVDRHTGNNQVGISEVRLPGVDTSRYLIVPGTATDATGIVFGSSQPGRACLDFSDCRADRATEAEESAGLARAFASAAPQSRTLAIKAVARPTPETLSLLAPPAPDFTVRASSVIGNDPKAAAILAMDGVTSTAWESAPGDENPELEIDWPGADRTLTGIRVRGPADDDRPLPDRVTVTTDGGTREVGLDPDGLAAFPAVAASSATLTFSSSTGAESMAFPEVDITGLEDLTFATDPSRLTGEPVGSARKWSSTTRSSKHEWWAPWGMSSVLAPWMSKSVERVMCSSMPDCTGSKSGRPLDFSRCLLNCDPPTALTRALRSRGLSRS